MIREYVGKAKSQTSLLSKARAALASAVVLSVLTMSMPSHARATWQQKSLPGFVSPGAITGMSIAAGAIVALVVYYKIHHKEKIHLRLDAQPVRFDAIESGQATRGSLPIINKMGEPVTVKSLEMLDSSNAFTVSESRHVPFTIAPGEIVEIPVELSANHNSGRARLRLVASAPSLRKDGVEFVRLSYGGESASRLAKLVHKQ
jgi:hypothetical protein